MMNPTALNDPLFDDALRRQASDPRTSAEQLHVLAQDERLAALVAANLSTPPAVLKLLIRSTDLEVRRGLAVNPNTPPESLMQLIPGFPVEVFCNPTFPLVILGFPDLLLSKDTWYTSDLIIHPLVPPMVLNLLSQHPDVRIAEMARRHIELAEDGGPERAARASNPLDWKPWEVGVVLRNRSVSAALLNLLTQYSVPEIAKEAQMHVNLAGELGMEWKAEVTELIWGLPCWHRRRWLLALYEHTPPWILERLAHDPEWKIRKLVAQNPHTPLELLETLAEDGDRSVRYAVARHPNLSQLLIERLANSPDMVVRHIIADHSAIPAELRQRLLADLNTSRAPRIVLSRSRLEWLNGSTARPMIKRTGSDNSPKKLIAVSDIIECLSEKDSLEGLLRATELLSAPVVSEPKRSYILWSQRILLARHPLANSMLLGLIAQDTNCVVRAVARAELAARQGAAQ